MKRCEECRDTFGRVREGYTHRLPDGQHVSLCLACASRWRMAWPTFAPRPYGKATRDAIAAVAIVGIPANG